EVPGRAAARAQALARPTREEAQLLREVRQHERSYQQACAALLNLKRHPPTAATGPGAAPGGAGGVPADAWRLVAPAIAADPDPDPVPVPRAPSAPDRSDAPGPRPVAVTSRSRAVAPKSDLRAIRAVAPMVSSLKDCSTIRSRLSARCACARA